MTQLDLKDVRPLFPYNNPTSIEAKVLMENTYNKMLKYFDGSRQDLEVRYHIHKHQNMMFFSKDYERYCILKAVRYCRLAYGNSSNGRL